MCAEPDSERGEPKKVVSPSSTRRAAEVGIERGRAEVSAACRALGLARSTYYSRSEESAEKRESLERIRGGESGASAVWVPACNSGSWAYWREGERETCAANTSSGGAQGDQAANTRCCELESQAGSYRRHRGRGRYGVGILCTSRQSTAAD